MLCFYLRPEQDDFNQIPELQVCIAEALYDAEAVLSNPSAFKAEEIRTLRDQITSNLERAWEVTGRSEDELTGVMVQISQVVAKQFRKISESSYLWRKLPRARQRYVHGLRGGESSDPRRWNK